MLTAILVLAGIAALVNIACWLVTVVKMFQDGEDGGVGKAIFGIICGLYAFIWGFQTREKHNRSTLMYVWTAGIVTSIILNVVAQTAARG